MQYVEYLILYRFRVLLNEEAASQVIIPLRSIYIISIALTNIMCSSC